MFKFILTTLLSLSFLGLSAQNWAELLHNGRANFYEIQSSFEAEWNGKDTVRGSGWKPYKRWEFDTEERVYPSGELPPRQQLFTEYQKFMKTRGKLSSETGRSSGDWQPLGPDVWQNQGGWNPGIGRVNFIYEEPGNQSTIYVGTPAGGLWRTENTGDTWTPLTDDLPSMGVSGVAIDPNNTDVIYIATGDRDANDYNGVGVLKSTDYGVTWQTTGIAWDISNGIKSNWLIMHPTDAQTLYLATNDGLYKTTDGADSWQLILNGNIREVDLHPTNPETVYAVSNKFYRSEDGGLTFDQVTTGLPSSSEVNRLSLAVSPASPDRVYLLAGSQSSSGYYGTYRSTNAGVTFNEQSTWPNILGYSDDGGSDGGQSWYDLALAADPNTIGRIITGGINVWKSDNSGFEFSPLTSWAYPPTYGYTHADIHFLRYYGDRLYCGSDGGIFISYNNGGSWTDLSEGLTITQLYRMDFSDQQPNSILVGTQDNGTNMLQSGTFYHLLGGDGNGAEVNENNPDIMYGSYPYGSITASTNGGDSFFGITNDQIEDGLWVTPFVLDPNDQDVLVVGLQNMYRYTFNDGWENIGDFSGGGFRTVAVAPSNSNYIYGTKGNDIFRTTNGGNSWDVLYDNVPDYNITEIVVDPTDPNHIILTLSGYSDGEKVFESFDAGDTFSNISNNLPNIPANCLVLGGGADNGIYVGTDAGIYYTNDNLANWVDFMDGLPKTSVRQLKISESLAKLRAGTYGRGIWESNLYESSDLPPSAEFTSSSTTICVGDSVQFTDLSYNAAPGWTWTFGGGTPSVSDEQSPVIHFYEEGTYTVTLEVSNANGTDTKTVEDYVVVLGSGDIPPYSEPYEGYTDLSDGNWLVKNPDQDLTWEINPLTGVDNSQSAWINNMDNTTGRIDELVSPTIDLSNVESASLTFMVAYAQQNPLNNDRLRLYISNNCGESWNIRGQWKGTNTLPTAPPTEEPFIPANNSEWQTITATNITPAFFGPNFKFKFEFLSDNGNNIYIDNINLTALFVGTEELEENISMFEMYPNPAQGQSTLQFSLSEKQQVSYQLLDVTGKVFKEESLGSLASGEHQREIFTHELAKGMYLLKLTTEKGSATRKLFIE